MDQIEEQKNNNVLCSQCNNEIKPKKSKVKKLYKCNGCNQDGFKSNQSLKKHMKRCIPGLSCSECNCYFDVFSDINTIKNHHCNGNSLRYTLVNDI